MRKNILIRVLSLIAAMSCVVVMLCACSKDKDKKEKEKSEKSEPKSKYAMDVGEFEGKEGEDYTNQVFLFSGIVEKVYERKDVFGATLILKSENDENNDEYSFTLMSASENLEMMEQAAANKSKVYILATSVRSGVNDNAAAVDEVNKKHRVQSSRAKVFYSDIDDVEKVDKAYEDEKEKVEILTSKIYNIDEFVDNILNSSMEIIGCLGYKGVFNPAFLIDYEKRDSLISSSEWISFEKKYIIDSQEMEIRIEFSNNELNIEDVLAREKSFNVEFRTVQYTDNSIGILIEKILE